MKGNKMSVEKKKTEYNLETLIKQEQNRLADEMRGKCHKIEPICPPGTFLPQELDIARDTYEEFRGNMLSLIASIRKMERPGVRYDRDPVIDGICNEYCDMDDLVIRIFERAKRIVEGQNK